VDTFDSVSDIHRKLAIKYQKENSFVDEAGALLATKFEADRDQGESDRKDDELRAMMDRLYPEFQRHHDEYARAVAEGRTPPAPGRRGEGPRHPSPNPPAPPPELAGPGIEADTTPAAPVVPESTYRRANDAETHGGKISAEHGEKALAYMREHECSWAQAVFMTNTP
jgi:hypothetical protein